MTALGARAPLGPRPQRSIPSAASGTAMRRTRQASAVGRGIVILQNARAANAVSPSPLHNQHATPA